VSGERHVVPGSLARMLRALAGGAIFGEVWGPAPPLVLALHGWARTHADFAAALGPGAAGGPVAVVAPDLPGFGASPPPPQAWGSVEYAGAVAQVLDASVGPSSPVVVVGHSLGGRIAVRLAVARPDLVRGLVLTGAPLLARAGGRPRPDWRFRVVRAMRRGHLVSEARLERARQRYGSADYRRAQGVMRGVLVRMVGERYEDALASLTCPVTLVWGDDDPAAPLEVAHRLARLVPHATLQVVPGAGHLLPVTAPAALRAAVDAMLAA